MKNSTLKMLSLLFFGFVVFSAGAQEWNISSASFNALGTISTTTTVDGLTIYATADASVVVDANAKSLDGMDFTSRMKLGGSGTFDTDGNPVSRILAFPVTGNTTITVAGMSSSSSSDRQLIIMSAAKDTIGVFPALGTPITKGEFTYTGGPTTIYLFSPSSGVNLYYVKAAPAAVNEPQEWNISTDSFNALGTLTADTTVNGLTIFATSDASVTVDANSKTLDSLSFTSRLKLGGSGTFDSIGNPVSRILSFNVGGNTTITVAGMSSSSSSDRQLIIADAAKDTIGIFPALGTPITSGEFVYTGGPTTIYMYSPSSGVNVYYIRTTPLVTGIKLMKVSEMNVYPNPASGKVYINAKQTSLIGIYSITGQLVKQQQIVPSRNSVDISDLHSGMYFVKMMGTKSKAQKLIVQ